MVILSLLVILCSQHIVTVSLVFSRVTECPALFIPLKSR